MIYGMPWSIRFMYVIFGCMIQQCYRQLHHEKAKPLVFIVSLVQHCYLQLHHHGKVKTLYVIFGCMIQQCYRQLHHGKAKPLVCILSLVQHCYLQLHHHGKGKTLYVIFGCAVPLHQETRRPPESFVASQHEEPIQILHQPRDWCGTNMVRYGIPQQIFTFSFTRTLYVVKYSLYSMGRKSIL